jgi:predicted metal-dependent HD superfamily phosphohydrolase
MRLFDHRALVAAARLHYAQPHRGYHGPDHLDELIELARQHTPALDEAEQLALLFHDAVYIPGAGRGENERLSALLMRATVPALDIGRVDLDRASRIIEATTHAEPPATEAARVCDLDLWRLAAPWEAFQRHALGIRPRVSASAHRRSGLLDGAQGLLQGDAGQTRAVRDGIFPRPL